MSPNETCFVVDLGACTGCQTCAVACLDHADLGDDAWLLCVNTEEAGLFPDVRVQFRVAHCWHCAQPACLPACAFDALWRAEDGTVQLDRERCTGCGACVAVCPFGAVMLLADGLAAKCNGCPDERQVGREPVCVRACPMRALAWGPTDSFSERPRKVDAAWDGHGFAPRVRFLVRPRRYPPEDVAP